MIKTLTLLCAFSIGTSAALANTTVNSSRASGPAGVQIAKNTQSNPMDANARMKKKKMMKGGMMKDKGTGTGMDNGMSGSAAKGNGMNNGMTK